MDDKVTVLLVEDNETYRKAVKIALEVSGFTVLEATNGKEAWELLSHAQPKIIVSDVSMPEMDGITLLTELKKNTQFSALPIIMLTNRQEEIDHAVKLGANEAILKASLTPRQVVDVCRKHLLTPSDTPTVA